MSESEDAKLTVDEIDRRFSNVTALARKKRLNAVAIAVVGGSRKKYQKDLDLLMKLKLPEDRKITCSNRAVGKSLSILNHLSQIIKSHPFLR